MESTKLRVEGLAAVAAQTKAELDKAQAALARAIDAGGAITSRILESSDSDEIAKLAVERVVTEAKIENLGVSLPRLRGAHEAAVAARKAAQRELDEEMLAEATEALHGVADDLERKLEAMARDVACDLRAIEERRRATWTLARAVGLARGQSVENIVAPDPGVLTRPDVLTGRFLELLNAALHAASKAAQ